MAADLAEPIFVILVIYFFRLNIEHCSAADLQARSALPHFIRDIVVLMFFVINGNVAVFIIPADYICCPVCMRASIAASAARRAIAVIMIVTTVASCTNIA